GEAAWNGNNLKGLAKTGIFLINFKKGNHTLYFLADQNPILESIALFKSDNKEEINYFPEENNPAQDGNRRQWITATVVNLPIKNLNIKAIAKNYSKNEDDDDIKLIIDGNIQKNEMDKSHKNWFWCGRILNGQEKEFNQELNLAKGLHYIEFWADRTPEIKQIKIVLGKTETDNEGDKKFGKIALYKDIEEADFVNLRSGPEIKDNIITQVKTGETVEIIDDIIEGEYIQNKSNIWHKIRHQEIEGYILSSYIEINGQIREQVIEKIKILAKLHGINNDYAVALAGCESRYKPYAVSYSGALGIFQLTGIAREDLRKRFNFEISERESFEIEKNIEGGIIYLKHLFDIYKGSEDYYKKVTATWNVGSSLIPAKGAISYNKITDLIKNKEVRDLVEKVEQNRKNKNWNYIFTFIFIGLIVLSAATFQITKSKDLTREKAFALENKKTEIIIGDRQFKFNNPYPEIKSILVISESSTVFDWQTKVVIEYKDKIEEKIYSGFLNNAYLLNTISFDRELFIIREEGQNILTSALIYNDKSNSLEEIKFVKKDKMADTSLCCSYVIFKSLPNGIQYDIAVRYLSGNYETIYKYDFSNPLGNVFLEK
ncbi:transglycosylase SLT domain-containing protein, partial [Patescibacteria group bacterium]|nr:transglycosylase SLT domain-containing protein [Patescibacteria group bacterium]MBU4369062.1 transglycosylase SLT domain-containing protein [Patescibacteria group bacterium]